MLKPVSALMLLLLASCTPDSSTEPRQNAGICQAKPVFDAPPLNLCRGNQRVRLTVVGDVLLHWQLQEIGYAGGFSGLWAQASPYLRSADITVANLEGPVAPGLMRSGAQVPDPGPVYGTGVYTGYPTFNYHPTILQALRTAGVDLVTTANNHAMDRGSLGADLTLQEVDRAGIGAVGTIYAGSDRGFVWRQSSRLGDIAFIACSFSTNGIPDPENQVLLCYKDKAELLALVRQEVADTTVAAVIVLPHWGQEYVSNPDVNQKALAQDLVAAGATAIIGTHPHAVQPFTQIESSSGQAIPVAYSTGNFIAAQDLLPSKVGALAILDLCASTTSDALVADRFGWIAAQMEFTPQAFWLNIASRDTQGPMAVAYEHLSKIAPGYSAQPLSCEGN